MVETISIKRKSTWGGNKKEMRVAKTGKGIIRR